MTLVFQLEVDYYFCLMHFAPLRFLRLDPTDLDILAAFQYAPVVVHAPLVIIGISGIALVALGGSADKLAQPASQAQH